MHGPKLSLRVKLGQEMPIFSPRASTAHWPARLLGALVRVQVPTTGDNGRITAIQAVASDGGGGEPHSRAKQRPKHVRPGKELRKRAVATCIPQPGAFMSLLSSFSLIIVGNIGSYGSEQIAQWYSLWNSPLL